MITAIVLISCQIDRIPEAAQEIADVPGVSKVYSVTGDVDLVAIVQLPKYEDLAEIVANEIAKIPAVESMRTHIAFRAYSKLDLEEAFHLGLD